MNPNIKMRLSTTILTRLTDNPVFSETESMKPSRGPAPIPVAIKSHAPVRPILATDIIDSI
ncbi:hypothetical protein SAMN05878482_11011 [Peribacillus simplex]|uniref:Uncharacterized protein n=1 Tax=Peribacillus simplex TaxID=1478 RepID=A0A9X8WMX7_9BACI|nr:hypothetical protein SAMN05878482_11011 [Peribacillus simplex]